MTDQMRRSWLVQRLTKPRNFGQLKDNPFSFGGGLQNGGLSSDAMDLLRPVFGFDYMGAAEFEFGAVPKALQEVAEAANRGDLIADSFSISLADVAPPWQQRKAKAPEGESPIFVICQSAHREGVEQRIREWAKAGYTAKLKENTRLFTTLRPFNDFDGDVQGWLELDNGFLFFTSREMWEQTASLFGLTTDAEVSA